MSQLLKKEFTFTALPLTYIFILFAFMTFIPGYPILVGAFFFCMGIFQTFQYAKEQNDVLYSVLMPVRKRDVVTARYAFIAALQMAYFILCALLTAIRSTAFSDAVPYAENAMMNANIAYLGYILLVFAVFNTVFVGGFWKSAYYTGKPFLLFSIIGFVIIGAAEALHHIPGLAELNSQTSGLKLQLPVLLISAIAYTVCTFLSLQKSRRTFERIDL